MEGGADSMIKECIVKDGKVINIGSWDEQRENVEISPAEYDEDGNIIKEGVFEEQIKNPFPVGATIEERDFDYDPDRGWYEIGTSAPPSLEERQASTEEAILVLMEVLG
jgi:hypothetical protein